MDPVTISLATSLLLELVGGKKSLGFAEAQILQGLIDGIAGLFKDAPRTCVHKTHACTYREGSCIVLLSKGANWQMEDITSCPYRKQLEA